MKFTSQRATKDAKSRSKPKAVKVGVENSKVKEGEEHCNQSARPY
jgi:hypothetical protein